MTHISSLPGHFGTGDMMVRDPEGLIERARQLGRGVLWQYSGDVDRENRFASESMQALRESGLLGFYVPTELGGLGGDARTYARIAEQLAWGCMSTTMNWAMHAQQVSIIAKHGRTTHAELLHEIATKPRLVASVTTEYGKGGDLLRARTPLVIDGETIRLKRATPITSYAMHADAYFMILRASETAPESDVRALAFRAEDIQRTQKGQWRAMGMHGTQSVPMEYEGDLPVSSLLPGPFRPMATDTMIPVSLIGWGGAWLGACRGAYERLVRAERDRVAEHNIDPDKDSTFARLARVRVYIEMLESHVYRVAEQYDSISRSVSEGFQFRDTKFAIALTSLKVTGSEIAFKIIDELVQIGGIGRGYLNNDKFALERVFRDLRSGAVMQNNDRLLETSGRLLVLDAMRIVE